MRANKEAVEQAKAELIKTIEDEVDRLVNQGVDKASAIQNITNRLTSHIYREKAYGNIPSAEAAKQVQKELRQKTNQH